MAHQVIYANSSTAKTWKIVKGKVALGKSYYYSEKVRNMSAKAYRKLFIDETD